MQVVEKIARILAPGSWAEEASENSRCLEVRELTLKQAREIVEVLGCQCQTD